MALIIFFFFFCFCCHLFFLEHILTILYFPNIHVAPPSPRHCARSQSQQVVEHDVRVFSGPTLSGLCLMSGPSERCSFFSSPLRLETSVMRFLAWQLVLSVDKQIALAGQCHVTIDYRFLPIPLFVLVIISVSFSTGDCCNEQAGCFLRATS